jgi:hypothetical protein
MSNVVNMSGDSSAVATLDPAIQSSIVLRGDLSGLNEDQKKQYYLYRCKQVGLDPAAKPFDLLTLNGKQILYANASATQQLCALHKLSTQITHRERVDGIYLVSVRVTGSDGRVSENQGAVDVGNLVGERLANAILKATTKAIRRSVLAHCGLGMLDETEVETIPQARVEPMVVTETPAPIAVEEKPEPITTTGIAFMLPNTDKAYKYFANDEEFVDGYLAMVDQIMESQKLNAAEKLSKITALEGANDFVLGMVEADKPALFEVWTKAIKQVKERLDHLIKKG